MKNIKTVLHSYTFNLKDKEQKAQYGKLVDKLTAMGLVCFTGMDPRTDSRHYAENIHPLDGQTIELETKFVFNNQWNTAPTATSDQGLRVFDWAQPHRIEFEHIVFGMWLEQTEEMKSLRDNTYKCGYCGKNHYKPKIEFCSSCLDSEYLQESDLDLLLLLPVSQEDTKRKGVKAPESLVKEYRDRQLYASTVTRPAKEMAKAAKRWDKDIAEMKESQAKLAKVVEVMEWAKANNLNTSNFIVYSHTNTICIGWQRKLSKREVNDYQTLFAEKKCPHESVIQFETEEGRKK